MKKYLIPFLAIVCIGYASCSDDSIADLPDPAAREIWTGPTLTFEKAEEASPTESSNQDRLTGNVWLTRGNSGGQIYNAKSENTFDKENSPAGTQWAVGNISDIDNLSFKKFRDAIKPEEVVGKNLVLFLVEDNTFLSVKFTKWSKGKKGGFAYERSSQ